MAQSVSNEALWVKLSEVEQKFDKFLIEQKSIVPTQEPAENKPDFTGVKEELITEINEQTTKLGRHNDSHFEAHRQNFQVLIDNSVKILNIVSRIRKQQKETVESQGKEKEACFDFYFFKVRKTSFAITALALLVLILTLFCMKQQNDYSLLLEECYRQSVEIREIRIELDSAKHVTKQPVFPSKTKN